MNVFDQLVRERLTPALAPYGMKRHGRGFRVVAESGYVGDVYITTRNRGIPPPYEFFVSIGVTTVAGLDWFRYLHSKPTLGASIMTCLWHRELRSKAWLQNPSGAPPWRLGAPDLPDVARELTDALGQSLPVLMRLLDGAAFLKFARDPGTDRSELWPYAVILVLMDGDADARAEAAAMVDGLNPLPNAKFVQWARARLSHEDFNE